MIGDNYSFRYFDSWTEAQGHAYESSVDITLYYISKEGKNHGETIFRADTSWPSEAQLREIKEKALEFSRQPGITVREIFISSTLGDEAGHTSVPGAETEYWVREEVRNATLSLEDFLKIEHLFQLER